MVVLSDAQPFHRHREKRLAALLKDREPQQVFKGLLNIRVDWVLADVIKR
jgi:hypothetical protein